MKLVNFESKEKKNQIQLLSLVEDEVISQGRIISGFLTVLNQNEELIETNKKLKTKIKRLQKQVSVLLIKLGAKQRVKEKRKFKRFGKRDSMTPSIYEKLITTIPCFDYKSARLRIAFLILTITGMTVSQLLRLKMKQLIPFINSNWISMNRSKLGPSSHEAYLNLTTLGKKLVDDRKRDFQILFAIKELDGYVFSSEKNNYRPLRSDTLTKQINLVLRKQSLEDKLNLTSYSFRIGFISQIWKNRKYIEFIHQVIEHTKLKRQ